MNKNLQGRVTFYPGGSDGYEDETTVRTDPRWSIVMFSDEALTTFHGERPEAPGYENSGVDLKELRTEHPSEKGVMTAERAAKEAIIAILTDTFHEAIEYTTVNGERIATAHTGGAAEWKFMEERLRSMVNDYVEQFPPET